MTEKLLLSDSIHSLRTAYRYALEAEDKLMAEEIDNYAVRRLGLTALEVDYVYLTAKYEENNGKDI
ncbi:hypothetical protein KW801_01045 [Candidatus Saccharibacteria bacterium]|nr:hypothetical protein [Candidatus Saccharibacteria bacterium]